MAKVLTLTKHIGHATIKRDHRTKHYKLTPSRRRRIVELYTRWLRRDPEAGKPPFYIVSTTGFRK